MIDSFSGETINEIGYYVYRLIDPRNGQTFYVGKGKGNRVFQHVKCVPMEYDKDEQEVDDDDPRKYRIIREIHEAGLKVIHLIQRWGLTEQEAFQVESALIDAYQGLANIQKGHHHENGVCNVDELEARFKKPVYEEPGDFKYIIIKVKQWRLDELEVEFPETVRYEATRGNWKISPKSPKSYPYAFSVTNGVVCEVYEIEKWETVPSGRKRFIGNVAPEAIKARFVGKRIPDYYSKKGMASPVLYSKN